MISVLELNRDLVHGHKRVLVNSIEQLLQSGLIYKVDTFKGKRS